MLWIAFRYREIVRNPVYEPEPSNVDPCCMKTRGYFIRSKHSGAGFLALLLLFAVHSNTQAQSAAGELEAIRQQIERRGYTRAERRLGEHLEQNPSDAEAWELLGVVRQGRWDFEGAADAYRRALDLGRENAPLLRGWIESEGRSVSGVSLLFRAKRLKDSAVRALELDPYNVDIRAVLAAYYYKLPRFLGGDKREAGRLVEELVEMSPADGYYLMGERAKEEGKPDSTVLGYWAIALEHNREHTATLRSLGLYWMEHDSTGLAVDYYRRAISSDPDNPDIYLSFGRAYNRVKMNELGAVQFRKALEIDPFYAPARFHMAEFYESSGDREAAVREFQSLALYNPAYRSSEVRKRLRQLIG